MLIAVVPVLVEGARWQMVPAYVLNSALGRIPFVGRIFSAEKGGGLFAATYTVRGSIETPTITVNPLAALAPGFLRNLFSIFDGGGSKPEDGKAPEPPKETDR